MLGELIQIWPGGPSVSLGRYFVLCKYAFSALFLVWCAALWLKTRRSGWLLVALVVLAAAALIALQRPLGRPYGVVDRMEGVNELGQVMVVAARGSVLEGRLVGERHPFPAWAFFVSMLSGFRPERLLSLYAWLPLVSLITSALAAAWLAAAFHDDEAVPDGVLPILAAAFVLFLSSYRLSFLDPVGPLWPNLFWLVPRLGVGLAGIAACARLLSSSSPTAWWSTAALLAVVGWAHAGAAIVFALGVALWVGTSGRWWRAVPVAIGTAMFVPFVGTGAASSAAGRGYEAIARTLSGTVEHGLVFWLALGGVYVAFRSGRDPERLVACLATATLVLAIFTAGVGDVLGANAMLPFIMAISASYGLYCAVAWTGRKLDAPSHRATRWLVAGSLALSLPWCFPFWWEPVRMDPVYVESVVPISRRFVSFGESIRSRTDPDAVFAAGPSYAPWIPALGGRRILADGAGDDVRARTLDALLRSEDAPTIVATATEWGVTHVAAGRLDRSESPQQDDGVNLQFFENSPIFREQWRDRRFVRVFELAP